MGNSPFFPTNLCVPLHLPARSDVDQLGVVVGGDGDRADAAPHRGDPALEQDDGRAQGFDLTDVLHIHLTSQSRIYGLQFIG